MVKGDISVIVPVYNVEEYLEQCLDSILAQTYQPAEVLLINDGSTDGSREICESYAGKYDFVTLIDQENQGQASARNTGLDLVSGDFIAFVDSDDYISEHMLATLHDKAVSTGADMVKCGTWYHFHEDRIEKLWGIDEGEEIILDDKLSFFRALLNRRIMHSVCDALYRKKLFDNLRFEVGKFQEDTLITPQILLACDKIVVIPDGLYYYRQREGSIMHMFDARHFDIIECNHKIRDILIRHELYDELLNDFHMWFGVHLMNLIKHAARYSSYPAFRKHVRRFHKLVPEQELGAVLAADTGQGEDGNSCNRYLEFVKKSKKVLGNFRQNPDLFWIKAKYNKWKKRIDF